MPVTFAYQGEIRYRVEVCPLDTCPDPSTHGTGHRVFYWGKDAPMAVEQMKQEALRLYLAEQPEAWAPVV